MINILLLTRCFSIKNSLNYGRLPNLKIFFFFSFSFPNCFIYSFLTIHFISKITKFFHFLHLFLHPTSISSSSLSLSSFFLLSLSTSLTYNTFLQFLILTPEHLLWHHFSQTLTINVTKLPLFLLFLSKLPKLPFFFF